jgi:CrcB protein
VAHWRACLLQPAENRDAGPRAPQASVADLAAKTLDRGAGGRPPGHVKRPTPRSDAAQREVGVLRQALWVGLGGFVGANARVLVSSLVAQRLGSQLPYGTFLVNISGCLALGLLIGILEGREVQPAIRPALALGFLGAYTTFSTFGFEAVHLIREGNAFPAATYVVASVAVGLAAVWLGLVAGRMVP